MRVRLDSLYLRLALVLLAALVAGFATMFWVFHSHLEENRLPHHGLGTQIRLIEELLRVRPDADITGLTGFTILSSENLPATLPVETDEREFMAMKLLSREIDRPVDARRNAASPGLWIRLDLPDPKWVFIAPPHRPQGIEPWAWGLLVAFGIILLGGMALLWRVQVPLRKLEHALGNTLPGEQFKPLRLSGPREVLSLAEQFNQMMNRLQRHDEDRNVMLAGVAHDLRAPITRMRLQLETGFWPEVRPAMERNLDSVEAIVNQFILFARGGRDEALAEHDLAAFIAEVLAPYEDRGVVIPELEDGEWISADIRPDGLRRALCNLVDNALEYGAPPIQVSLSRVNDKVIITVEDAGPGIPLEQRSQALRPFSRLDQARTNQGHCGLGLAIVARVVEDHDGELLLGTSTAGGLRVELVLPARIAGK